MSLTQIYVECDYWVLGYAEGDEFCIADLEGPFMGRKKKKKKNQPVMEQPPDVLERNDDDLVMAIVRHYLEKMV